MKNRGIEITAVFPSSPVARIGLRPGDRLLKINGHTVADRLDLHFFMEAGETELEVLQDGCLRRLRLVLEAGQSPGWEIEPMHLRTCRCHCSFCFVDQMPPGLRASLYVKDEDYRFSFLFGNYLTLTGLSDGDLKRILQLKLSPLYVSIHATDPVIRGRLLGLRSAPILHRLRKLIAGGIKINGQIVLVPGWNDGTVLENSLRQLMLLFPGLVSLSVVPVGLTEHRSGLIPLRLLSRLEAESALESVVACQQKMMSSYGVRWVFPADELILTAGWPFPEEEAYEGYPQLENGVGLVRWTLQRAQEALSHLPNVLPAPRKLIWITGSAAHPILCTLADNFVRRIRGLEIEVVRASNRLFGASVSVAGLLSGADLASALEERFQRSAFQGISGVYLPPHCLSPDGLLLDDWTVEDLRQHFDLPFQAFDGCWEKMILGSK